MPLDLSKRVRRPFEDEDIIKDLVFSAEPAFGTMADLLVFAAAFAYYEGLPRKSFEKAGEPISLSVFVNAQYDGFIFMLAAQSTGDFAIASAARTDEVVQAFEEYSAAGLTALRQKLSGHRPAVDALRDLALVAFTPRQVSPDPDFEKLMSELG